MARTPHSTRHPRTRTKKLIEDMIEQRTRMLVLLSHLARCDLYQPDPETQDTLNEFLGILVDYIAAGHFGLYQRIADGTERRNTVVKTAREIYQRIAQTTAAAVEFSDRYGEGFASSSDRLADELSALGEEITTRIELEDRLIIAMLGRDFRIPDVA